MTALNTPERRHTMPLFIAALDTGARKSSLVDYLKWKDIKFDEEIIILTAYKGKSRNKQCWPVPMTNRLKMELLKLQLRLKHNNPDALVFEEAKLNLRKVWRAAYAIQYASEAASTVVAIIKAKRSAVAKTAWCWRKKLTRSLAGDLCPRPPGAL